MFTPQGSERKGNLQAFIRVFDLYCYLGNFWAYNTTQTSKMATYLSRLAKYYIADFLNHREVVTMTAEWREMSEVYHSGGIQLHRMPPPEYAMTTEFDNCLRKDVSPQALEYLFTEGPQAVYWYRLPTGFLSTIVEVRLAQGSSLNGTQLPDPHRGPSKRPASGGSVLLSGHTRI